MKFVQYDPSNGKILASGEMPEPAIDHLISTGQSLLKTGEDIIPLKTYKVNLVTKGIEYLGSDASTEQVNTERDMLSIGLKNAITDELLRTDYTQAMDAPEHMTQQQIDTYRMYRQLLRIALSKPTPEEMYDAVPKYDPNGDNKFARFEFLVTSKPDLANLTANLVITNVYSNTA